MTRLNRAAGNLAVEFHLKGGTDITGYALLGHACEMTQASQVGFRFYFDRIPVLDNALPYAKEHIFPGGSYDNLEHFNPCVTWSGALDDYQKMLLYDAQTSGGLLLSVPASRAQAWEARAKEIGQPVWKVGEVMQGSGIEVV